MSRSSSRRSLACRSGAAADGVTGNGHPVLQPAVERAGVPAAKADCEVHARVQQRVAAASADAAEQRKRQLLAQMCRLMGARAGGEEKPLRSGAQTGSGGANGSAAVPADLQLSPRVRQTLERLLHGDSEKQVAQRLQVSSHTVHVYVKTLYRKMKVNSRGELLAKFVRA